MEYGKLSPSIFLRNVKNEQIYSFVKLDDISHWYVENVFLLHTSCQAIRQTGNGRIALSMCAPTKRYMSATLKTKSMVLEYNTKLQFKIATEIQT